MADQYRVYIGWDSGKHYVKNNFHFQATAASLGKAWDRLNWLKENYDLNPYATGKAVIEEGIERSLKAAEIDKEPIRVGHIDAGIGPTFGLYLFIHKVNI
jgi:hypothetical protein